MTSAEHVYIDCGTHRLEARVQWRSLEHGALLCHPHPLYGGSMENNVVLALESTYGARGWTTLRFNFRGVEGSTGTYGDGDGEVQDIVFVHRWLHERGVQGLHLAGYSFGAWVAVRACAQGIDPQTLALVSPPVDFLDFTDLLLPPCPTWILVGDGDAFAKVERVRAWVESQKSPERLLHLDLCPHADHFYWGREQEIRRFLGNFLDSVTGSAKNA
ncbi:MAG: hypothetical protein WHS46_04745 [Desulfosoma sp.]